ncbi:hypothetical protein Pcac1_g22599 [Phytophthora cactorum]|uniref:Uncharacterized protein n=1 Tax=Phytophthora cactorum TaxID=29920 RepID=A0A329RGM9_9STRA|nr:hypothetical protein Pcac1_g22599 [Phytophthora cactorum]KAG3201935.1 hypothetical protein PC128_g3572 [Phytophthora cactorum]RAW22906.1 hypothetical protein PC110_g20659 [Phytophthora cactorum]
MEESKVPMAFAGLLTADQLLAVLVPSLLARTAQDATQKQNTVKVTTTKPQKKRICQQKLELEYLRGLVGKLESNLAQLEASKSAGSHETEAQRVKRDLWKPIVSLENQKTACSSERPVETREKSAGTASQTLERRGLLSSS